MAPFTAWLPAQRDQAFDLVVTIVGDGIPGLKSGLAAFEEALASEGYQVLAQQGRMNGQALLPTIRLRVSTDPVNSMGNGCDVLAYLGDDVPPLNVFGLGRGSAVICEAESLPRGTQTTAPTGVIAYHVPFENLSRRIGKSFSGKGLIGIGVLTQFLMIPPDRVRTRIRSGVPRRYFDAGVKYATDHVRKRDVFALPVRETIGSASLLNPHQAVWLGLGLSQCTCESACVGELDRSATAWVTRHLTEGRQLVSALKSRRLPGLTAYRSLDGRVIAIVGGTDSSLLEEFGDHRSVTLIPGNLQDLVCLMGEACRLGRNRDTRVFVLVDEELAQREQSISRQALETIAGASRGYGGKEHGQDCGLGSEWDLDLDAEVGYVAWGAAQGVVRDAISLCRRFGLKVAALYPKMLEPLPVKDLRVFAASSKQVVVVEPDQQGRYTDLVKSATGHKPATIRPAEGNRITPMDLFMREDLGAALSNRPKGALHEFL
jgi:hypothetical protein